MPEPAHTAWELQIDEATKQAPAIIELVGRTTALMDAWMVPGLDVLSPYVDQLRDPQAAPERRFEVFVHATGGLADREGGGRFYLGVLCHAYRLHALVPWFPLQILRAEARRVAESICDTPLDDLPTVVQGEPDAASDASGNAIDTDDDVLAFLRVCFGAALAYSHGYCEAVREAACDTDAVPACLPQGAA